MGCNCGCCGGNEVKGLAHIGVFVRDMKKSLDFYVGLLGFVCYSRAEVPSEDGPTKLAFLRCGTCEIELVQPTKSGERKDGAVDHIALRVSGIDALASRLADNGVKFDTEKPVELPMLFDKGVKCIFFRGPDGERLELSEEI